MIEPIHKKYSKIPYFDSIGMSITQKLHGTNVCVYVYEKEPDVIDLICGCRSRWISPENDHYGFAKFVLNNKQEFIDKLGIGRHFGEWVGKGINSGEGLSDRRFFLFNWEQWAEKPLPPSTFAVPVLYNGILSVDAVNESMNNLKRNGSYVVKGYMKPEGIVINIGGHLYKNTFDNNEISWKRVPKEDRLKREQKDVDISHLLQPLRLEKLLSQDEKYIREYPRSLPNICADYVKDLEEENQIIGDEDEVRLIKKAIGKRLFSFVKQNLLVRRIY